MIQILKNSILEKIYTDKESDNITRRLLDYKVYGITRSLRIRIGWI